MKQRTILTCNNPHIQAVVTISVRTNQPGHDPLTHYESVREFNEVTDAVHKAMAGKFHARKMKFSR